MTNLGSSWSQTWDYDPNGGVEYPYNYSLSSETSTFGNAVSQITGDTYDACDRFSSSVTVDAAQLPIENRTVTYDTMGNLASVS